MVSAGVSHALHLVAEVCTLAPQELVRECQFADGGVHQ